MITENKTFLQQLIQLTKRNIINWDINGHCYTTHIKHNTIVIESTNTYYNGQMYVLKINGWINFNENNQDFRELIRTIEDNKIDVYTDIKEMCLEPQQPNKITKYNISRKEYTAPLIKKLATSWALTIDEIEGLFKIIIYKTACNTTEKKLTKLLTDIIKERRCG